MRRRGGSITVFLSLSGLLIFALLGTLVETARYTVCKNHVARTIRTATEGLLTEYSRPLYEHYGIFFIESEGTPYHRVIANYVGDTLEASNMGNKDFLAGHLTDLQITDQTYLGDNKAAPLRQEIVDYMGRVVTKDGLDKLLKKSSQLQNVEKEAEKIEQTVEEEKEEAKLDQQLLELMSLVDGISVRKGKISCCQNFVKCFATKKLKGQNFSVTESVVWGKMKPKIDERTRTWKISDKTAFLSKIRNVKRITERAIEKGKQLQTAYQTAKISREDSGSMIQGILSSLRCLQTNHNILRTTEEMLRTKNVDECMEELEELWRDYDTTSIVFDYTGVQESGGGDNPKNALESAWRRGILNLVCKDPKKISGKTMAHPDSFAEYYKEQEKDFSYEDCVTDFANEDSVQLSGIVGNWGRITLEEFCLDEYIKTKFGSYIKKIPKWKQVLEYGLEYVVAGKGSDEENLKSVLTRILLMRTVVNYGALLRDYAKKAEAQAAALTVVGFTGLQPLIALVKTLILLTWSMVESMVDVAGLLQKKHIPFIKSPSDITTSFPQVFEINSKAIVGRASRLQKEKSASFGYQEYMLFFLASTRQSTRLYRVMDLIQHNMRLNGYEGFQLGTCVYDVKVKGTIHFTAQFFRLLVLEKMIGRNLQNYSITKEIIAGY